MALTKITASTGRPVELRNRFDGSWATGFEVEAQELVAPGRPVYRVRRLSDRSTLPGWFDAEEIRPAG